MKLTFITFPQILEALKFSESDWRGKSPRLLKASWAALNGGYRGQKYQGSDRSALAGKLKAMAESLAVTVQAVNVPSDGEFLEEALRQDASFDAIRNRVSTAIDQAIRQGKDMDLDGDDDSQPGGCCYAWVRDLYPGTAVYSMDGGLYQVDYTDDGEKVTLGNPVEVEMSYTPISMGESHRTLAAESVSLQESAYDATKGELTVTVIKPGMSKNKRFYPPAVLKKSASIFEGVKMFADHQSDKESKERPEGSVHNWVGSLGKVWAEGDGTVKAKATIVEPLFKAKLDRLNETGLLNQMGVSIRAVGEAHAVEQDGEKFQMVESLLAARSVDFVTYAGAGGQVEAMESTMNDEWDVDLIGEAEFRKRRPDLVTLIESSAHGATMKTLEQQLQETQTALAAAETEKKAAETKLQESEKVAQKATAAAELAKLLTETKLPEVAKSRIQKQFAEAVSIEGMKEAIADEAAYIESLGKPTKVTGLGAAQNPGGQDTGKSAYAALKESFIAAGMNEKDAEVAAAGR